MQIASAEWSGIEQEIAQSAFEKAYRREVEAVVAAVRTRAAHVTELEDVWRLNDFLSARRHEIDGKYDYQYPVLIFVFAQLIKEGWLQLDDLKGLADEKLVKISALVRM
ncbi:MAG: hypothetical protein IGR92_13700 [Leptolyngbyaceae cyanobacterium T60_A2020_046]|nr:hypothetical protein [Leptolyngbyaceae cyanobacterium T60_A2020_046]